MRIHVAAKKSRIAALDPDRNPIDCTSERPMPIPSKTTYQETNPGDYACLRSHRKIAVLTDGYSTPFVAKTAVSILRYRQQDVVAVIESATDESTAGGLLGTGAEIPVLAHLSEVREADAIYIGIAPPGGKLPVEWRPIIIEGLHRKMDIVSGLHDFLSDDEELVEIAKTAGARLIDVRRNECKTTASGQGFRNGCVRIHTVGCDCSIGKMVTSIEVQLGLVAHNHDARFLATGQTGIMISGEGVPVDCVVGDFVNGAAEELVKRNEQHEFLLIEGQGSISHPAYSAVTIGLLHGCAPDGLIFCYEAGRRQVKGFDDIDLPQLSDQMAACEVMANLRHPCKIIGLAVNTRYLNAAEATAEVARIETEFSLPACDVYRDGAEKLVQACIELQRELSAK